MKVFSKILVLIAISCLIITCGCAGVMGPDPEVVSVTSKKALDGLNSVDKVTVLLKNNGYEGNVNVKAVSIPIKAERFQKNRAFI